MGIQLCEQTHFFDGYVSGCLTAAVVERMIGNLGLFRAYLEQGINYIDVVQQTYYKASLYQNISGLHFDVYEYDQANRFADSALLYIKGNEGTNISASIFMSKGLALQK